MQTPQQVIEKLQKLLRLSESANRHEAELAMARAQEIAIKYKIELASVSAADQPAEAFERESIERKATFQQKFVDWIVRKHFNIHLVHAAGQRSKRVWYIGKPTDIAFAKYVYDFLNAEFPRLWTKHQRDTRCGQGERITYFYGLYQGLDAKLTEARKRAESEGLNGNADLANRYALAVVRDEEGLKRAVGIYFPDLSKARASRINVQSSGTFQAGRAAGGNININRPIAGRAGMQSLR